MPLDRRVAVVDEQLPHSSRSHPLELGLQRTVKHRVHAHQYATGIGRRPPDRFDHRGVGPRAPAIPPIGLDQRRPPLFDSTTTQQAQAIPEMGQCVMLVQCDHRLGRLTQPLPVPALELPVGVVVQLTPLARSHVGPVRGGTRIAVFPP